MKSTRKIIFLALMVGCGIMLQIIESFVPVVIFVPGFKIGFANIVSLLTLMLWDIPSMWCVALHRISFFDDGNDFFGQFLVVLIWGILVFDHDDHI